jgi:serine/threonine-protein kinase
MIRDQIAVGGFGSVYRAEHVVLGREAAIKVMHPELALSPEFVERFKREAQATHLIRHPNIVDIYDFDRLPIGRPYLIMELLSGEDLGAQLRRRGCMTPPEVIEVLEPLCSALAAAHRAGIVHRDLKASNVFLDDRDGRHRVVLLDFGIAKLLDRGRADLSTLGRPIGTPSCMAPEQLRGAAVDARTDVYGLGCLTFHMLTGEVPFDDDSPIMMQQMHLTARPPRLSTRAPVPPALDSVISRAMSKHSADRYTGADALFHAVRDAACAPPRRRRTPTTAQSMPVIGVHVEITAATSDPDDLDDFDDALILDIESVLDVTRARMRHHGFLVALQSGTTLMLVKPVPGGAGSTEARAAVAAAVSLADELEDRDTWDDRIHVNVCLHADRATIAGTRVIGGAITQVARWVPRHPLSGVVGSLAVFVGLDVTTEPIPGDPHRLRILRPREAGR